MEMVYVSSCSELMLYAQLRFKRGVQSTLGHDSVESQPFVKGDSISRPGERSQANSGGRVYE